MHTGPQPTPFAPERLLSGILDHCVADRTRGPGLKQHVATAPTEHSRPRASLEFGGVGSVVELAAGRVDALARGPIVNQITGEYVGPVVRVIRHEIGSE
jgi:hypothetical protein